MPNIVDSQNKAHAGVIKWKHFPCYWPFVRGIHRSPVTSPHKGQWRGALRFSLICAWTYGWVNNRDTGDSRRHLAYHDVTVMGRKYCVYPKLLISTRLIPIIVFAASAGRLNSPCLSDGRCLDTDSECRDGVCRCSEGFYQSQGTCSRFNILILNLVLPLIRRAL